MWLQGHMGQMQPVETGPWALMSLIGKLIQVSRHPLQDGISIFNPMGCHTVHMMGVNCMNLLHLQTAKKVGAG